MMFAGARCRVSLLSLALLVVPAIGARGRDGVLPNGGFELAATNMTAKPAHWFMPDGLGVQWVEHPDDASHGKCIRMNTSISEKDMVARWKATGLNDMWDIPNPADNAISDTYGLSYYSDAIPVRTGQAYRISLDYRGPDGGAKVWVRCYGMFRGKLRRRYEAVLNATGSPDTWTRCSYVFHPTRVRADVTEMKVMLYAFYPPGVYWFDNVRLEPIAPETFERERDR